MRRLDPQYQKKKKEYCLQQHEEEGLSPQESVERIAKFFVDISDEHEKLEVEKLPPNVREELAKEYEVPHIEDYQVHQKIKQAKKPNSGVEGDIPKKLVNEFSIEYSKPAAIIMNKITKSGEYPRQ